LVKQQIQNEYLYVTLYFNKIKKTLRVHRLVALAFIANPNNLPYINHKDENKLNNNVENLEWCDSLYNNTYGDRLNKIREKNLNNPSFSIPIKQIDLTTNDVINIFPSIHEAMRFLIERNENLSPLAICVNICRCCKGKRNSAYGFRWEYV